MGFNNMIARTNKKLEEGALRFYKAIEPMGKGQPGNPNDAQSAYNEIGNTLRDARKEYDETEPSTSPQGPNLLEKYRAFLKKEQEIYDSCFTPMIQTVKDNRFDPGSKWQRIQPYLNRASTDENIPYATLIKAQEEYCQGHFLQPQDSKKK